MAKFSSHFFKIESNPNSHQHFFWAKLFALCMRSIFLPFYFLTFLQIILALIASILWLIFSDWYTALSSLLGSIAWILPSFYFTKKISKATFPPKAGQNNTMLLSLFLGSEFKKLVISAILVVSFAAIFRIHALAFLSGYSLAVLSIWFWPFWEKFTKNKIMRN